ncbi:MAG: hypothetical protein J4224_02410 [Candidatus Diapherotrites archaeon]|uniref:Uncharacterized protein n=1 Tax=Candidatus Iainarchaeum sp. TaxID=3101447 RepID=A0A7J4IVC0_9ARCH|nr:MAG: hypothetical protein QT03_C0001G0089 [archaeon GW2011_AR10]MBS3059255.1 hypothetical protein [Candidatus Diapherotrites archaeon]HIH08760.1 hypothetical protein [Candidatus Diapherotrites archaeon]
MPSPLLRLLTEFRIAFQAADSFRLKKLSNAAIGEAVLDNDPMLAEVAVAAYSLSKLVSKEHVVKSPNWVKAKKEITASLNSSTKIIQQKNEGLFKRNLSSIVNRVRAVDRSLGNYVRNISDKGRIKVASTAYARGLSLSQAARITGADKKELQNYIGITKIHDEETVKLSMKDRMGIAREIFS